MLAALELTIFQIPYPSSGGGVRSGFLLNLNYMIWFPSKPQLHAFLLAAVCWAIWKARNDACFNAKLTHHPAEIICRACAFLSFWAGLHNSQITRTRYRIRSKKVWECWCRWPARCLPVTTEHRRGCFFPHLIKTQVTRPLTTKACSEKMLLLAP